MNAVASRAPDRARRLGCPLLVVVSAPSGAGKTTLCDRLLERYADLVYSVSCTTRPPRGREENGTDYRFLSAEAFERRAAAGEFLEQAEVHGHRYGTLRRTVTEALDAGRAVLLDIDVQGAGQLREALRSGALGAWADAWVDIFIAPPSLATLRARLERRGEDSPESIERRLRNAAVEKKSAACYRHTVVNDNLDDAFDGLCAILEAEAARRAKGSKA